MAVKLFLNCYCKNAGLKQEEKRRKNSEPNFTNVSIHIFLKREINSKTIYDIFVFRFFLYLLN